METGYAAKSDPVELLNFIPEIVVASRTGDYAGTARLLNRFLQQLQLQLSRGFVSAEGLSKITYSLETLLAMQQMKDWVAFADILEYEFVPLWKNLCGKPIRLS